MIQWLEGEISAVEREAPVKAPGAMSTEPALVLHRFVSLTNEPDFLRLGWMRERPLKPPVQNFGVWVIWPCTACPPVEPPSGAVCGGRWPRAPIH
jgi:hypothetical protein